MFFSNQAAHLNVLDIIDLKGHAPAQRRRQPVDVASRLFSSSGDHLLLWRNKGNCHPGCFPFPYLGNIRGSPDCLQSFDDGEMCPIMTEASRQSSDARHDCPTTATKCISTITISHPGPWRCRKSWILFAVSPLSPTNAPETISHRFGLGAWGVRQQAPDRARGHSSSPTASGKAATSLPPRASRKYGRSRATGAVRTTEERRRREAEEPRPK
ncbi:hypothetical protein B0T11DRAFT_120940 [Plectosphaerella cucumerina]|uniref:Uncharacterized protein n=1 Tax=Plectosphaerella cucumerina TaxID=40658 RepID=A0A8K0X0A2_9PEZI|nr:hypothetical protein B0T11DRAFT_120940 [Plectosphaerella cucumerina]